MRTLIDRWGDLVLGCGFFVWAELDVWRAGATELRVAGGRGVLSCLLLLVAAALAVRRSRPAAALLVASAALVVAALVIRHSHGIPVEVFLAFVVLFYSVGAHCEERRSPAVGGVALAAIAAVDLAKPGTFNGSGNPRPAAWLVFAIAWLVGRDMRRRRQRVEDLQGRAERLEREREEKALLAAAEERTRIARELHDVVAHSVSVIVAQARAGPHLVDDGARAAAFRAIESTGRDALVELRRLLGILRSEDQQLAIGPQPGLDSLRSLVEQVNTSGLPVRLRVEGTPVSLPAGVDLAAYRIVQEALTNVVKHADAAAADVLIRYDPSALEVSVVDDGIGAAAAGNGGGHGLIGVRERVALYGGTVESGPRGDGGYEVRARLPLGSPQ
jgi:signal transduction histidine kinase